MIKLLDILNEIANTYKDDSNTWTHITDKDEVINSIKSKNKWLGVNEDLSDFSYVINTRRLSADKQNTNVPNFYKGSIYPGSTQKYLITFTSKQSYPGDNFESSNWKEVDYPLIPNSNRVNQTSFKNSKKIGVLKPEYRDIKNFKFYKYDNISKKYVEFDIKKFNPLNEIITETDPKVGTGKKPKGSGRRLYTDENPKDTVSIKFKTVQDIKDTLSKTSFKSKPHARQSQIINLIHQRVRAAYSKSKDPEVKARLKRALDYIEKRKEASKEKTERLRKLKETITENKYSDKGKGAGYDLVKQNPFDIKKLADKGIIFVTKPGDGKGGIAEPNWEGDASVLTLYNMNKAEPWMKVAVKNLRPQAIPYIQKDQYKLFYNGKYNQILWGIEQKKFKPEDFYLYNQKENVAPNHNNRSGKYGPGYTPTQQNEDLLTEKCWKGYTQKGFKIMFGKRYPNCVKK